MPRSVNSPFSNAAAWSGNHAAVARNMEKPKAPHPQSWSVQNGVSLCLNCLNIAK
jgi:hypothetical protein